MIRFPIAFLFLLLPVRGEVVTVPHPSDELPAGKTVVWSPLFQATWDTMNKTLGATPSKTEPPDGLMARLDEFKWDADKVMPEGSWKVWAGEMKKDFLDTVNKDAAKMTGDAAGTFKLTGEIPGALACFGLLNREVEFRTPFFKSHKVPLKFGSEKTEVFHFGTNGDASAGYGEDVKVLAFRPVDGSHALEVSCKEEDDKVIFYRPPVVQDFTTACRWLRQWKKEYVVNAELPGTWADRVLHAGDEVRVPYVSLEAVADFSPRLQGRSFHVGEGYPWIIRKAEQVTKFELFEKGARVRVEASIEADPFSGGFGPDPIPRRFIYDRPFFVFLWRDGAEWPYFGVWIGDASGLRMFR